MRHQAHRAPAPRRCSRRRSARSAATPPKSGSGAWTEHPGEHQHRHGREADEADERRIGSRRQEAQLQAASRSVGAHTRRAAAARRVAGAGRWSVVRSWSGASSGERDEAVLERRPLRRAGRGPAGRARRAGRRRGPARHRAGDADLGAVALARSRTPGTSRSARASSVGVGEAAPSPRRRAPLTIGRRRALGDHPALVQHHDAVAQPLGLLDVVGHQHDGRARVRGPGARRPTCGAARRGSRFWVSSSRKTSRRPAEEGQRHEQPLALAAGQRPERTPPQLVRGATPRRARRRRGVRAAATRTDAAPRPPACGPGAPRPATGRRCADADGRPGRRGRARAPGPCRRRSPGAPGGSRRWSSCRRRSCRAGRTARPGRTAKETPRTTVVEP